MHDATKQLNALAGDHKESPLGEHEIALRGSRSADQSGRIKCEERPVACIIQVSQKPAGRQRRAFLLASHRKSAKLLYITNRRSYGRGKVGNSARHSRSDGAENPADRKTAV